MCKNTTVHTRDFAAGINNSQQEIFREALLNALLSYQMPVRITMYTNWFT